MNFGDKPLSEIELVHCLENLFNFITTVESLRNPTPRLMQLFLEAVMKDLQLNVDFITQEPWKVTAMIENRESYEDILPFISFFSVASQITETAGITDFSVKDIIDPKPKRTKKIFNYLLTLWKHVVTKIEQFEEAEIRCQAEIQEKAKLLENVQALEEKYKEAMSSKVDPTEIEMALKRKAKASERLSQLVKDQDVINRKYQDMKTELAQEQKEISELDVQIVTAKERLEELSNQILKSPTRLNAEVDELKMDVAEEEKRILDMKKSVKEKKQDLETFCLKTSAIDKVFEDVKEVTEKLQIMREECTLIDQLQKKGEDDLMKIKQMETAMESSKLKLHNCEAQMAQTELRNKSLIENKRNFCAMTLESIRKEEEIINALAGEETVLHEAQEKVEKEFSAMENALRTTIQEKAMAEVAPMQQELQRFIDDCILEVEETTTALSNF